MRGTIDLARFADGLEADPARVAEIEEQLERISAARRRYRADSYATLLARREEALAELALDHRADIFRKDWLAQGGD